MTLNDVIYDTPEMSIEKLHENLKNNRMFILNKKLNEYFKDEESILKEWDLIQVKKSKLSRSERDKVSTLVSISLIQMAKDGKKT